MNEFEIIRRFFERPLRDPDVLIGIGDDAAVIATCGRIAITVDTLLESVHFLPAAPADAIGHRALAVSLSDLAAMGARPRWTTLALTLPRVDAPWIEAFAAGFHALADRYGVALIGGNLARGPLSITVEASGDFAENEPPLTRRGARSGDDIYVTGTLGDAAAGLEQLATSPAALSGGAGDDAGLIERYLRPIPRVDAGRSLVGIASAAIDVSDGLASDLGHLCSSSGCRAIVDVESVPMSAALEAFAGGEAMRFALSGGDDYELCFTASPAAAQQVADALGSRGIAAHRIGRMVDGSGIEWLRGDAAFEPRAGYLHFT